MDRAIAKAARAYKKWAEDTEAKCKTSWSNLRTILQDPKILDVAHKIQNDLDIADARRKVIGCLLGYDKDSTNEQPVQLDAQNAMQQLKTLKEEINQRCAAVAQTPAQKQESAFAASAAGDRARLGMGPPCKNYGDLLTLEEMKSFEAEYHGCLDRNDITELNEKCKPWKRADQELIVLRNAVAKDVKGCPGCHQTANAGTGGIHQGSQSYYCCGPEQGGHYVRSCSFLDREGSRSNPADQDCKPCRQGGQG